MKIILGSSSKARKHILETMGYDFDVLIPHIDEKTVRAEDPEDLPGLLAKAKSEELQSQVKDAAVLLTSDSIAVYDGQVREKPESDQQAKEFLRSYGKKPVEIVTAVFAINTKTGKTAQGTEKAKVYFQAIPENIIDDLVRVGHVMYAAGGFIAEDPTIRKYIAHVDGNMDTVMGLPKMLTKKLIEQVSNE